MATCKEYKAVILGSLRTSPRVTEKDLLGVFMMAENCIMLLVPEMGIADLFDPSVNTNESTEISTVYAQMRRRGERWRVASTPLRVKYQAEKPGGYFFFCL